MSAKMKQSPVVIASTENMTDAEWHEYRRKGIGGSDAAAILGLSPFCTARDIYYEKIGAEPKIDDEQNWVAKQVGHRLESLVGEIFSRKTDLKIYKPTDMYTHAKYPFMLANIDYLVEMLDGTQAVLECKTAGYNSQDKWADGAVPMQYEIQVRHYMAVMDIDTAFCACLFDNNDSDFVCRRIDRDRDYEDNIIAQEQHFWQECVEKQIEPPYKEKSELILESIRRHTGNADISAPAVTVSDTHVGEIEKYLELRERKLGLDRQSNAIDEEMKYLSTLFIDMMGIACTAVCKSGAKEYVITYKPVYTERINKDGLAALKTFHPDIYDRFVSSTESRRFSVSQKNIGA
ncbi:MAG: YqaJ viral recombinase family protein [Oscillospiraceae bacterium]|nr:YqaJ viral recombinase family protein [Oscillospiraceae bacterium]